MFGKDGFDQGPQFGNIPLSVAEFIEFAANRVLERDGECVAKGTVCNRTVRSGSSTSRPSRIVSTRSTGSTSRIDGSSDVMKIAPIRDDYDVQGPSAFARTAPLYANQSPPSVMYITDRLGWANFSTGMTWVDVGPSSLGPIGNTRKRLP